MVRSQESWQAGLEGRGQVSLVLPPLLHLGQRGPGHGHQVQEGLEEGCPQSCQLLEGVGGREHAHGHQGL